MTWVGQRIGNACEIIVVIPACNEEDYIDGCITALLEQYEISGRSIDARIFEIIVLVNNSEDRTLERLQHIAASVKLPRLHIMHKNFAPPLSNVGTARRELFAEAARRFDEAGRNGYIATTDADTRVSGTWIASMLATFRAGADMVGGFIEIDAREFAALPQHAQAIIRADRRYRMLLEALSARIDTRNAEAWPYHYHHTGASLAVSTQSYRLCGGIPHVATHEDTGLVAALYRIDARIAHRFDTIVTTSGRTHARAQHGMGTRVSEWSELSHGISDVHVRAPKYEQLKIMMRSLLRNMWLDKSKRACPNVAKLAALSAVSSEHLIALVDDTPFFGIAYERFRTAFRHNGRIENHMVPLQSAIDMLAKLLTADGGNGGIGRGLPNIHHQIAV